MAFPFFFVEALDMTEEVITLSAEASKHCIQVLRQKKGDQVYLTDGKGQRYLGSIVHDQKYACQVKIIARERIAIASPHYTIGIAFPKDKSRTEWLVEKLTEIGIAHIVPLVTTRTEKYIINTRRLVNRMIAALLQSQQVYLPILHPAISFPLFLSQPSPSSERFIAHATNPAAPTFKQLVQVEKDSVILIGPEGDFSPEEIQLAQQAGYQLLSLGSTRLRTETAAIVAATLMKMI